MHTALRPFSTAAIALTAASVVAVAPITAPLPEAQPPTISSASVQLTASSFVDPVTRWGEVLTTTQTNLQRIVDAASANPFPVLNQIIANQTRYANTIGTALSSGADGLYKFATGTGAGDLPALVATAQDALAHGDAKGAAQQISYALTGLGFALFPTLPILSIPGQITQNIANVAMLIAAQGLNTGIIGKPAFGLLSLAQTSIGVTGAIAQSLVDAATAGDPVAAVSTIVNAPADFTDAMLNGQLIIGGHPGPRRGQSGSSPRADSHTGPPPRHCSSRFRRRSRQRSPRPRRQPRWLPRMRTQPQPQLPHQTLHLSWTMSSDRRSNRPNPKPHPPRPMGRRPR